MTTSKNNLRYYSPIDKLCLSVDQTLKTLFGTAINTNRLYPGENISESELTPKERHEAAAIMRINHAGEVCAQALYHSQALVSQSKTVSDKMQQAAYEEGDHLAWCRQRLLELGSHTSYLNPLWYIGSFTIGLSAGILGDQWNLGFLAETENQVVIHLQNQLNLLPLNDKKSQQILSVMQQDEAKHRDEAFLEGAKVLPSPIKQWMKWTSKIMVKISYWI